MTDRLLVFNSLRPVVYMGYGTGHVKKNEQRSYAHRTCTCTSCSLQHTASPPVSPQSVVISAARSVQRAVQQSVHMHLRTSYFFVRVCVLFLGEGWGPAPSAQLGNCAL
jgi:hypothetical protein